jgi:hypothetical protein
MTSADILNHLPEILNSVAAVITAVTGLIAVLRKKDKDKD